MRQNQSADLTFEQKTAINKRFQELYEAGMREGKHGHFETMFHAMHEAYAEVDRRPVAAQEADGFPAVEFAHVAALMRRHLSDDTSFRAVMSNNFNVILAALDRSALASPAPPPAAPADEAVRELGERLNKQEYCARWHLKSPAADATLVMDDSLPRDAASALAALSARCAELERENKQYADLKAAVNTALEPVTDILCDPPKELQDFIDCDMERMEWKAKADALAARLVDAERERDNQYDENVNRIATEGAAILRAEAAEARVAALIEVLNRARKWIDYAVECHDMLTGVDVIEQIDTALITTGEPT